MYLQGDTIWDEVSRVLLALPLAPPRLNAPS
jgi:hypothetical protein